MNFSVQQLPCHHYHNTRVWLIGCPEKGWSSQVMRGITLTSITDPWVPGARNRYCLSLHPISVRTELVRTGCYYILWI